MTSARLANVCLRLLAVGLQRRPGNPLRIFYVPAALASRTKPSALPPARSAAAAAWDLHKRGEPVAPLPKPDSFSPRWSSVRLLEALGQLPDVLGRPVRHLPAQVQAHGREHFLDLVQGLAA